MKESELGLPGQSTSISRHPSTQPNRPKLDSMINAFEDTEQVPATKWPWHPHSVQLNKIIEEKAATNLEYAKRYHQRQLFAKPCDMVCKSKNDMPGIYL